jgi:hypothetical protein
VARPATRKKSAAAGRVKHRRGPLPVPTHCFSIPSFCTAFGISEAFFHKLNTEGRGPRLMKIGRRTFVSHQAALEWQQQREAETAASMTAAE